MTREPISIADLLEEVPYDFWGAIFRLREGTRSVGRKYTRVLKRLVDLNLSANTLDDEDDEGAAEEREKLPERIIETMCDALDVVLEFKEFGEWPLPEDVEARGEEWAEKQREIHARVKKIKNPTVKKILLPMWKRDEIGEDRIEAIFHHIKEEVERRKRPTSTPTSGF